MDVKLLDLKVYRCYHDSEQQFSWYILGVIGVLRSLRGIFWGINENSNESVHHFFCLFVNHARDL